MKKLCTLIFCFCLFFTFSQAQVLKSPDGHFAMTFSLQDSIPYYNLEYNGQLVVEQSKLGFKLFEGQTIVFGSRKDTIADSGNDLVDGFVVSKVSWNTKNKKWEPVLGQKKYYINHYNELAVRLYQKSHDRYMVIRFRLFNDGLGFRYEFPQQENLNYFIIKKEETEFNFPTDMKAWWIAGDYDTEEYQYQTTNVSDIPANWEQAVDVNASQTPIRKAVQTPLMLKKEGQHPLYINLAEAAVIDYPGSNLLVDANQFDFKILLTPDAQHTRGYIQTPFNTPWRTIIVSPDAKGILASKMIFNLNEPTDYKDVSWIHPVKFMGVWWEMIIGKSTWAYSDAKNIHIGETDYSELKPNGRHGANNKKVKKYIDFAAANGFDALLIEGWNIGWEDWFGHSKEKVFDFVTPYPDFDIAMLNDYAHKKGIKLMMHHETSGSTMNYERHLDTAFDLMDKYGYDAVKTGYVGNIIPRGEHHYGQWMVQHYLRVVKKAARHHLMVDSHESIRPTGLSRTYPNWIAAEAARGMEYAAFGGNKPDHTTILPFTRLMGGPMDFTPGIFQTKLSYYFPGDSRQVNTTIAKQLALYVVMYSPLQMAADLPENYKKHMDAFQFIKEVALNWDDTRILAAEPGDYIDIARKAADTETWFVGGITDENARNFTVNLSFLNRGTVYKATVYEDGKEADFDTLPQRYHIYSREVTSKDSIKIKMARSGGYAIEIKPLK
ncbi:MAG TPA: glycoside hydrolase family 97 protein [Chitinophagaceae bacterium]|nr:glycoside hydrolase family 97 protein [Chitinophagaceae bacterium]